MAEAPGAGSGGSVAVTAAHRRAGQDHSMAEDQMLMQMSGLTVGAAAAAAAGAAKARGGKANASVYAAAMHAGEKEAHCCACQLAVAVSFSKAWWLKEPRMGGFHIPTCSIVPPQLSLEALNCLHVCCCDPGAQAP